VNPASAWAPYTPDARSPWNLRRVVHLHRRAGFGATWGEIQRDLKDGPGPSVDRLLAGKAYSDGVPGDFEAIARLLGDSAASSSDASRFKAWWIYRMLFGPDPLTERLVLMWHNHFATSNLKVDNVAAMRSHIDLLRKLARAPFGELLHAIVRDQALLVWLDATANRKGRPNENLARELMELFTMGVGHFTEPDVKEAARALTGWGVSEGGQFQERPLQHDEGEKTILGKTGRWKGDDLVAILLDSPATADRLAFRLTEQFMGEGNADAAALRELAGGLRAHKLDIGWAVETILRSQAFFADKNIAGRIVSPVEYVVGPVRSLELFEPSPSTLVLAEWTSRLGQDLGYPPNVGGWPGGRAWMNARAAIGRTNYASALVAGSGVGRTAPLDAIGLTRRHGISLDHDSLLAFYAKLLLGLDPDKAWRDRLRTASEHGTSTEPQKMLHAVELILAMPEAHMG
jgi:Protein of unknown function (DUF1800)